MNEEFRLSEAERALLIQLLEHEVEQLHVEIHHTSANSVREELKDRRELMRGLLERLQPVPVA